MHRPKKCNKRTPIFYFYRNRDSIKKGGGGGGEASKPNRQLTH